jgi:spore coat polysaccharide biosynthesis predicted glycosyltransferase SpsG
LGTHYALLRREFLSTGTPPRTVPARARRLLILMGGADSGNATLRVMEALRLLRDDSLECEAILGPANPHRDTLRSESAALGLQVQVVRDPPDLAERMARAEMAISAGGATLWELCYLGLPTLAFSLADNQRAAVTHLHRAGALVDGTAAWHESTVELARSIDGLVADAGLRAALARTARTLVDGRGAARVVAALRELGEDANDRAS